MRQPGPPLVRLFVALDLPDSARERLAGWQAATLAGEPALRVLPAESLHVTLCFLGWGEAGQVEAIGSIVAGCAAPVDELALAGAVWRPRARPRLLAVELIDGAGALGALQGRLAGALDIAGLGGVGASETRPFWPHVTVARVRRGAGVDPRRSPVGPPSVAFAGAALTLYRSRPSRAGAVYEPLVRSVL